MNVFDLLANPESMARVYSSYDQRKVADKYVNREVMTRVSTAYVEDGAQPYETAIILPDFNDGHWIIVEAYPDKETARLGHAQWISLVQEWERNGSPSELIDVDNAGLHGRKVTFKKGKGGLSWSDEEVE